MVDLKRYASKPENQERDTNLPQLLAGIEAAYYKTVRGLTEKVYLPHYVTFDAKAEPAPQRSPVQAATLGATTASKTATAAALDFAAMPPPPPPPPPAASECAAMPNTSHSHRTRRAIPDVDGFEMGWAACSESDARRNLFLGPETARARQAEKESAEELAKARANLAQQIEEARKEGFMEGQAAGLLHVESFLQHLVGKAGELKDGERFDVGVNGLLRWLAKQQSTCSRLASSTTAL